MYKIVFTDEFDAEMEDIHTYISKVLKQEGYYSVLKRVYDLCIFPKLYMKIGKIDRLNNEYRRMVINNYIVLYIVDDLNKKVFISHIYYKRRNYLG